MVYCYNFLATVLRSANRLKIDIPRPRILNTQDWLYTVVGHPSHGF